MKYLPYILLLATSFSAKAQQPLSITPDQADSLFLQQNLLLLAEQYNIDAQDALILQAKAYPNPQFSAELHTWDTDNRKAFLLGYNGEKVFAFEQLLVLGGKRKTAVAIAKQHKELAKAELGELLRSLRQQLHNSLLSLYQQQNVIAHYDHQLKALDTLITRFSEQAAKGNLPLQEVVRLKSVYLKINNDRSEMAAEEVEALKNLQLLLQTDAQVRPVISDETFDRLLKLSDTSQLYRLAIENRPDVQLARGQQALSQLQLSLEKRQRVPDVNFTVSYDQQGNAWRNQYMTGIGIPLPLWDRNRGNIRAAEAGTKATALYSRQKETSVRAEVFAAWQDMQRTMKAYTNVKQLYTNDFDTVLQGINSNFLRRNITILEFVDFLESYNESLTAFEEVKNQLAAAAEQINFVTATNVY
ncbi:TolC family protein [Chitinophaga horti]|uniref:TolC family protein n=1 Tax=Chitinophaga horti TaxID=2920382 RepID=A0ABY6IZB6_9BACT|nr:TolC family protein [Chitinophaga horti]UYQ92623.1 TolC family protein [Chitinophaga horti]